MDETIIRSPRRQTKLTGSAKITLTAYTILGFVGGWNLIARLENQPAQVGEPSLSQEPISTPAPLPAPIMLTPTPWPTVPTLAELPPIPTLRPTLTTFSQSNGLTTAEGTASESRPPAVQVAPLPALAPLPTLAPLPALPAPPPPPPLPVVQSGGSNHSGGS